MPKRLHLVTALGKAVVDVEDNVLVLSGDSKFVVPEDAIFVISSPYLIEVENVRPGIPISAFVSSSNAMLVARVEDITDIEYQEISVLTMNDPGDTCQCTRLGYVTVKTI